LARILPCVLPRLFGNEIKKLTLSSRPFLLPHTATQFSFLCASLFSRKKTRSPPPPPSQPPPSQPPASLSPPPQPQPLFCHCHPSPSLSVVAACRWSRRPQAGGFSVLRPMASTAGRCGAPPTSPSRQ
jgi:hypothetical protein